MSRTETQATRTPVETDEHASDYEPADYGQMNRELLAEKMFDAWRSDDPIVKAHVAFGHHPGLKTQWLAVADLAIAETLGE